jgi:hypothetical protein
LIVKLLENGKNDKVSSIEDIFLEGDIVKFGICLSSLMEQTICYLPAMWSKDGRNFIHICVLHSNTSWYLKMCLYSLTLFSKNI